MIKFDIDEYIETMRKMKQIENCENEDKKYEEEIEKCLEPLEPEDILYDVRNEVLRIIMREDVSRETIDMAIRVYNKVVPDDSAKKDFFYEDIYRSNDLVDHRTISKRELIKVSLHEYRKMLPSYRFGVYGRNGNTKAVHNPKRSHVWVDPRTWIMIDACHVRRIRKRKKNDERG